VAVIVYISIGNSDDKLTQSRWSDFIEDVELEFDYVRIHGCWFSDPRSPYQNACWCIEFDPDRIVDNSPHYVDWDGGWRPHTDTTRRALDTIQRGLRRVARRYQQDSIAWAQAPDTVFLRPEEDEDDRDHQPTDRPAAPERDGLEAGVRPAAPPAG
jgi:hypothetical protein